MSNISRRRYFFNLGFNFLSTCGWHQKLSFCDYLKRDWNNAAEISLYLLQTFYLWSQQKIFDFSDDGRVFLFLKNNFVQNCQGLPDSSVIHKVTFLLRVCQGYCCSVPGYRWKCRFLLRFAFGYFRRWLRPVRQLRHSLWSPVDFFGGKASVIVASASILRMSSILLILSRRIRNFPSNRLRDCKRLGYSDNWINQRLKSIEIRKELTDEWKKHGIEEGPQFAILTALILSTLIFSISFWITFEITSGLWKIKCHRVPFEYICGIRGKF